MGPAGYERAMRSLFILTVALSLLAGCKKDHPPTKELSVDDAAKQFAAGAATPVDANTPEYREGAGWVPGAVLLSEYHDFKDAELPADKDRPLVFYCTSRM